MTGGTPISGNLQLVLRLSPKDLSMKYDESYFVKREKLMDERKPRWLVSASHPNIDIEDITAVRRKTVAFIDTQWMYGLQRETHS